MTIDQLIEQVTAFRDARDWKQFHTPRNLAAAIVVEAAELQEPFLWSDPTSLEGELKEGCKEELADVLIYALSFADVCRIDVAEAVLAKLKKNDEKYPVELARGNAKKSSELLRMDRREER